ncbi:DNA-processing protein DprA [Roseburia hominis]
MEQMYEYWLACLKGIGSERKRWLKEQAGTARDLYYIEETERGKPILVNDAERKAIEAGRKSWNLKQEYDKLKQAGVRMVIKGEPEYPKRLRSLTGMPYALYVKGELPGEEGLTAAIVGARRCTAYGETMTLEIAERLAECGIQIISGMARGIDGAAHRGALNAEGSTYAVLGCGPDVCYPREHRGLYQDLLKRGGILSELPPGTPPLPQHFPARNRIISGLSDLVLVMEAREKSGSLITADQALEQGRDVYALPGPVNSSLSRGCHELIRQGAGIITGAADLLEDLGVLQKNPCPKRKKKTKETKIMLESAENLVYSNLGLFAKNQEELSRLTGLAPSELAKVLVSLELKGYIEERSKNYYVRRVK